MPLNKRKQLANNKSKAILLFSSSKATQPFLMKELETVTASLLSLKIKTASTKRLNLNNWLQKNNLHPNAEKAKDCVYCLLCLIYMTHQLNKENLTWKWCKQWLMNIKVDLFNSSGLKLETSTNKKNNST
jgi:hypothetical protein